MIRIQQAKRDLYAADFEILQDHFQIGTIHVQGKLGSMDASAHISVFDKTFDIHCSERIAKERFPKKKYQLFREYTFQQNDVFAGRIFQVDWKRTWLSITSYLEMHYENGYYFAYSIADKNVVNTCVYSDDQQIAQIKKSTTIKNDLHHFDIYARVPHTAICAILFCVYGYIISCFRPGISVSTSYQKVFRVTKDPFLLSKYHPEFLSDFS